MKKVLFLIAILKFTSLASQDIPILLESEVVKNYEVVTEVAHTIDSERISELSIFDKNRLRSDSYSSINTLYDVDGVLYTKVTHITQPNVPHWFEIEPDYIFNSLGEKWSIDSNGELLYYDKSDVQSSEPISSLLELLMTTIGNFEEPPFLLLNSILPNNLQLDKLNQSTYKLFNDKNFTIWNIDSLSKTTKSFDDSSNESYVQYEKFDRVLGNLVPTLKISRITEMVEGDIPITRVTKQTFSDHYVSNDSETRSLSSSEPEILCTNDDLNLYLYSEVYPEFDLMIYNQEGRILHSELNFANSTNQIDISSYPPGVYILNINSDSFTKNIKFVKS